MKKETLEMAKAAYKIESECIAEMLEFFDDSAFEKAVTLLKNAERIGATLYQNVPGDYDLHLFEAAKDYFTL